jgi:hypothetical protein
MKGYSLIVFDRKRLHYFYFVCRTPLTPLIRDPVKSITYFKVGMINLHLNDHYSFQLLVIR